MCFKKTAIVLLIIVAGCKSALYMPSGNTESATREELIKGRKLYINNCGSCHLLYDPKTFPREKWQKELEEMQERAKIDDQTKELILKYLWNVPG